MELKVCCASPDIGCLENFNSDRVVQLIEQNDVVIFPEYFLEVCNLDINLVSEKLIIYGSKVIDNKNKLYCANENELVLAEKISLTPWESHLSPGEELTVFDFKGVRIAVLICFDIEFPNLAAKLKQKNVELLLVPSATESIEGYYRVNRCASARAVELGCCVITCHLIGEGKIELLDKNLGANNMYLPAQSLFSKWSCNIKEPKVRGDQFDIFKVPIDLIRKQKSITAETNPALN